MSNMKSKLAASVRQVKSQAPAKPAPEKMPSAKSKMKSKLAASVRQVKAQAPAKPAPEKMPPAKTHQSPAPTRALGEPQASGSALFPGRVWPD